MNTKLDTKIPLPLELFLSPLKKQLQSRLLELIPEAKGEQKTLYSAARYCVESPGKLLRPLLTLVTIQAFEGNVESGINPACALEYIHNYSLIHDDLPSMDDDNFRRGRPTLHTVYDEAIAVLTGDFFLTYAFDVLANSPALSDQQKIQLVKVLTKRSGDQGMLAGQVVDIEHEGKHLEKTTLEFMHTNKTAALITGALEFAGIICQVSDEVLPMLVELGNKLGLAYQIIDDILDVTKNSEILGKPAQSDLKKNKATAVSCLGLDQANDWLKSLSLDIYELIRSLPCKEEYLLSFAKKMLQRNY